MGLRAWLLFLVVVLCFLSVEGAKSAVPPKGKAKAAKVPEAPKPKAPKAPKAPKEKARPSKDPKDCEGKNNVLTCRR